MRASPVAEFAPPGEDRAGRKERATPALHRGDVRQAACFAALAAAVALFFYRDELLRGRVVVFRDQYTILLALDWVVRLLSTWGYPPLWTPFQVLGKPLAADPLAGVFYPVNGLARAFPFPLGHAVSVALHHVLAATGFAAFLRQRRLGWEAAAFGGLLFGFGGMLVSCDNMINALQSATWLPWTLLAFDRWCERRGTKALVAVALGIALTLLGGLPEVFAFEQLLFLVLALDRRGRGGGPRVAEATLAVALADLLGCALAAVQWVPATEYILRSSRIAGLDPSVAADLSLAPAGLLAFLLPRHFVGTDGGFHETAALWEPGLVRAPWALTLYMGPVLVAAAALRGGRRLLPWLAGGLAFLLLACGGHVPGYRWLIGHAALLRSVRYPEKALLVVHFILAGCAATGLDAALREPGRFLRIARAAFALAVVGSLSAFALSGRGGLAFVLMRSDLRVALALSLVLGAVALGGVRHPRPAAAVFALVALADLIRINAGFLPTVAASALRTPPASLGLMSRGAEPLRIYGDALGRKPVSAFPESFLQERELLLWEVANYWGVANLNAPASVNLTDDELLMALVEGVPRERLASLLARFGVGWVTSPKDLSAYPGLELVRAPQSAVEAWVFRVDRSQARVRVAHSIVAVARSRDAVEYLHNAADPASAVAVATVDVPPGLPQEMQGTARLVSYRGDEVEFAAEMATPGLVVVGDAFDPGWRATIDEVEVPVVRADHFVRGVFLAAGTHHVVMRYVPRSHRVGLAVSLAAGLLALVLCFRSAKASGGSRSG